MAETSSSKTSLAATSASSLRSSPGATSDRKGTRGSWNLEASRISAVLAACTSKSSPGSSTIVSLDNVTLAATAKDAFSFSPDHLVNEPTEQVVLRSHTQGQLLTAKPLVLTGISSRACLFASAVTCNLLDPADSRYLLFVRGLRAWIDASPKRRA
jgi:hypothetical protein